MDEESPMPSLCGRIRCLLPLAMMAGSAVASGTVDGRLDRSFGSAGMVRVPFPEAGVGFVPVAIATNVAVLADGRILVTGAVANADGDLDFAIVRLNGDGSLDTSFGTNGGRRIGYDRPGSSRDDLVLGMAVQGNGRIVLAGQVAGEPEVGADMGVVRLTANGNLDSSFGIGGRVLVPFNLGPVGERDDTAFQINLQADGKLLLAGLVQDGPDTQMALARLDSSGLRDTTFAGDGRLVLDFRPHFEIGGASRALPLPDGRIVVGGVVGNMVDGVLTAALALGQVNANGSLDTGFGDGGLSVFQFPNGIGVEDQAFDLVRLGDGRLLACGHSLVNLPFNTDMACMRFLADGTPDPAFAPVIIPFDLGGSFADSAQQVVLDGQGRIVLAGYAAADSGRASFAIARLQSDGGLDASFGNVGRVTFNNCIPVCLPGSPPRDVRAGSVAIQQDGKLVVGGYGMTATGAELMLVRLIGDSLFANDFEDH